MRQIIDRFGGRIPFSRRVGAPLTTVHNWYHRDRIPPEWDLAILAAAQSEGVALSLEELALARHDRRLQRGLGDE